MEITHSTIADGPPPNSKPGIGKIVTFYLRTTANLSRFQNGQSGWALLGNHFATGLIVVGLLAWLLPLHQSAIARDQRTERLEKPLCIDLFAGLFGWGEAFALEGYTVVGFDLEDMCKVLGQPRPKGCDLVLQDVMTLHGSQFKDAAVIVASPPCQKYSYMAMPWTKAKALAAWYREDPERIRELTALFDASFRIAQEAGVPLIVENVRGAQPWVGPAKWDYGSFYLWGDLPVLMPAGRHRKQEGDPSWFYDNYENSARRFGSKSKQRKAWSAQIAKIPFPLARHIARCFQPREVYAAR